MKNEQLGVDIRLGADDEFVVSDTGDLAGVDDIENVRQALILRLNTPQGDLWAHPEYGNGAYDILSESMSDDFLARALDAIRECVNQEPRVRLIDITQEVYHEDRMIIYTLQYEILNDTRTDNLVFTIDVKRVMESV